jgi:hypothetical protein
VAETIVDALTEEYRDDDERFLRDVDVAARRRLQDLVEALDA